MPSPVILQKAVTPQMAHAYVRQGLDRVAGYVVRATDVAQVTSTEDLIELHGLTFEGSPFRADQPVHVLHLPQPPSSSILKAVGGTSPEAVAASGGGFLERPPFRGDGTAVVGDVEAELAWLEHSRLSPGTRLWRFEPGAAEPVLVGTYHGVVFGWQDHENDDAFHPLATRGLVGSVATTADGVYPCDVRTKDDGTPNLVTIVSYNPEAGSKGFTQTKAGTFARQLSFTEVTQLAENYITARWHGLPVRIIDEGKAEDGTAMVRLFSLGRDAAAAERLGMDKMDAGWYETTAPAESLTDVVRSQRVPAAWARESQKRTAQVTAEQAQAQAAAQAGQGGRSGQGGTPLLNQIDSPMVGMPLPTDASGNPLEDDDRRLAYGPALQTIAQGVVNGAPVGWQRIRVLCRMLGNGGDVMVAATTAEGKEAGLQNVPQQVARSLAQLRHLAARDGEGSWFTALVTVEPEGKIAMRLDTDNRPTLTKEPDADRFRDEARFFPRDAEHTPDWLREAFEAHGIDPAAEARAGAEAREEARARRDADIAAQASAAGGAPAAGVPSVAGEASAENAPVADEAPSNDDERPEN